MLTESPDDCICPFLLGTKFLLSSLIPYANILPFYSLLSPFLRIYEQQLRSIPAVPSL